ncbi:ABC transporter A family member 1-like isoform X2 [Gigantopelta aegis]|uniref:ABC transporter A family member 1-like isoform X2 n=1 Tax=Gigantopelta aegis TaxID=1735272 RepID=UPI001B88BAE6|nr:ABC transporter A family member 1-like isoform X2 [Gigantopelta aegis]
MKTSFWSQLKSLLWRNFLLKKRNKRQFLQEVFFPVFFVSLMAMIKAFTKPKTFPVTSFPENSLSNGRFHFNTSKKLLVSPNTTEVETLMTEISTLLGGVQYETFFSQAAAEERYKANPTNVAAGIIFGFEGGTNFNYAIRMPYRSLPSVSDVFTKALNQGQCREDPNGTRSGRKCRANFYLTTGFVWLQNVVDSALIKKNNVAFTMPNVSVQLMPKDKFTQSLESIQIGSAIYFVFAYCFFINFLCVDLVAEKERKIREGMKMMGLRDSVWWLSWALIYMVVILFVTVVVVIIAFASSFFKTESLFMFFIMMLLYGLSIVNLAFVMTPFFIKAQVAGLVAAFSTIVISLLYFIVSMTRTTTLTGYDYSISPAGRWALCLLSPVAFSLAIDQGIFLDIVKGGMTLSNASTGDFPLYAPIVMLLADSFLYLILAVYLDHVIPGEYGPRYKPWFCLTPSYWCGQRKSTELTSLVDAEGHDGPRRSEQTDDIVEPVSPDLANKAGIRISKISKVFKDKRNTINAIDGLTLDIYEGQITALLGHNGAGKTTLINMLCGLSPPSSGTATIYNMDVSHSGDMERIRSMTGVCPQHDILYDELSCREHLDIFAGIKGVREKERADVVKTIMKAVDIVDQADVLAKNLSGGQKRKLSVAIALIGDPKMLILDEPTAGMDPYSRRHLWSLLKNSKEGKIILLTTHFMDEADILADRKAIINHGKLKCCGSSLFLKQRFGIGYHLNMVVEPECNADRVTDLLRQHVSGIEMKRSHGKELAFTMPMSEVSRFPGMFTELEATVKGSIGAGQSQAELLGIISYGVFMTSLEEVFLKIGSENEDKEENETTEPSPQNEQHSIPMPTSNETVNLTSQRFWTLMKMRFKIKIRNTTALIFQIFIPIVLVIIGCVLSKQGTSEDTSFTKPVTMKSFYVGPHKPPFLAVDTADTPGSRTFIDGLGSVEKVNSSVNIADLPKHWVGFNLKDLQTGKNLTYTAMYNDSAIHSLPAVINLVSNGLLAMVENITASSLMWPSVVQSAVPNLSYNSNAFSAAFILAVAFVVVPTGFAVEVVADRQIKARSQLRVSGITFMMYWVTLFLFHLAIYFIPAVISIIIVLAAQIPSFITAGAILTLVMLFLAYIPANLLLAYVFSYAFETFETCQAVLPNVFIFSGIIPYIAISLMDMLGHPDVAKIVHYVMCVIDPPYIIFGGIYYIERALIHIVVMIVLLRIVDLHSTGGSLVQAIMCCISKVKAIPEENSDIPDDEDDDVKDERHRVNKLHGIADRHMIVIQLFLMNLPVSFRRAGDKTHDRIDCCCRSVTRSYLGWMPVAYVRNLRKEFKKRTTKHQTKENSVKVAVQNATFAVDKNEVFGLLGPNGAGKTTILNMVIAETSATKGKIIVAGHNVHSSASEAFQAIGYCPQHDALWPSITLKEHLACYAAIKGIPRGDIDSLVNYFVDNLKVTEHADKRADKMSGGTRRKVSYAISMLGKPQIVLLDEPSTGMDPQSKRFLWDTKSSSFMS